MNLEIEKKFPFNQFFSDTWNKKVGIINELFLVCKKQDFDKKEGSLWYYVKNIRNLIKLHEENNPDFQLNALQIYSINLFDTKLINDYVSFFSLSKEKSANNQPNGFEAKRASKNIEPSLGMDSLREAIYFQASRIGTILGIAGGAINLFDLKEYGEKIFNNSEEVHNIKGIRSFIDLINSENNTEFTKLLMNYFSASNFLNKELYRWQDALFALLSAHCLYHRFEVLDMETQNKILTNFFYKAIVCGAPVRTALVNTLYETRNVISYMDLCAQISGALNINSEKVPIITKSNSVIFSKLFEENYLKFTDAGTLNDDKLNKFATSMYGGTVETAQYCEWLKESISIYAHLFSADLIENNRGGELNESQLYHNDLMKLIAFFGLGKDGVGEIAEYYKKRNPRVTMKGFINSLKNIVDLKDETTINNCIILADTLHSSDVISIEDELIQYDEKKEQFQWTF